MNNSIWNKRIPTLLGIFFIISGIAVTSMLVRTGVITVGKAAPTNNPEDVRITNIASTAFTVSYRTNATVLGSISYGTTKTFGTTISDDRDQKTGSLMPRKTHYFTVKNAKPNTTYYFEIISGENTFLHNDEPFQLITGITITTEPAPLQPAAGKIVRSDGLPIGEAMVFLGSEKTQSLSVLVNSNGTFIIPLNALRNTALDAYASPSPDQIFNVQITDGIDQTNATVLDNQMNPIPIMTLSQNYDFTVTTNPVATPSAQLTFPLYTATIANNTAVEPQILTPKKNEGLVDQQPLFKGTAQPDQDVSITIHSDAPIVTKVKANANGQWSFRPPENLAPGQHTISIITKDASGVLKTITQSFTVYAEGSQVGQSATPSATPVFSPTPTLKPTTAPTLPPTLTPTSTPTPTAVVIAQISPTQPLTTPTIIITPPPTAKGGKVTQSPGSESVVLFGIFATGLSALGILLLFLTRYKTRL